jgi:hypothetical protein
MFLPFIATTVFLVFGSQDGNNSVGLENMAKTLRGDVRLISIGDSYSSPYWSRIAPAALRVWPITNIEGICNGADLAPSLIRCTAYCEPVFNVHATDSLGYSIEREGKVNQYFGLPLLCIREIYTDSNFSSGEQGNLFEFELNVDELDTSVHGVFSNQSETVMFRLLYRAPSDYLNQPNTLLIKNNEFSSNTFSPIKDARKFYHLGQTPDGLGRIPIEKQINAYKVDMSLQYDDSNLYKIQIVENTPLKGTNDYFDLAGAIYRKTTNDGLPSKGLYFTSIGDGSWSYAGYGSNTECSGIYDKNFSVEQFTHWLDVTTLRLDQPVVFLWTFDVEPLSPELLRSQTIAYIDQAEIAANSVGIISTHHILVTPHMLNVYGENDIVHMTNHHTICSVIANERENVSHASIFSATDGVMFDGTPDSLVWLKENGFDNFNFGTNQINLIEEYGGNFLDSVRIHPNSKNAAAFFAAILGNIIREAGCPADLIPNGVIDIEDLLSFIAGWGGSGESDIDINEDGITNIIDLLILLNNWGECWPVQSPFDTPTFF